MEHKLIAFEVLRSECERDELAKPNIRRVNNGDWKACTQAEGIFMKVSGLLTFENGLLYDGIKSCIPPSMRNIVNERAHDTHPGVEATKNIVNRISLWHGKDVETFMTACSECAKFHELRNRSILGQMHNHRLDYTWIGIIPKKWTTFTLLSTLIMVGKERSYAAIAHTKKNHTLSVRHFREIWGTAHISFPQR